MADRHDAANAAVMEAYIRRLSELKAAQTTTTQTDLDEIALELGLTEADLERARHMMQAYLEKGERYSQYEQWDEAVEALEQALSLGPLDYDTLSALAETLSNRYQVQGNNADRKRAMALAQQCVELRPNDPNVLKIAGQAQPRSSTPQRLQRPWLGLGVGLALGLGFIGLSVTRAVRVSERSGAPLAQPAGEGSAPAPVGTPVADFWDTPGDTAGVSPEVDIPLQFEDNSLRIDPRLSRLSNYEERSFYKLQGVLINQGQTELIALNLKVEYLDAAGQVILEDNTAALRDSDAPLRPGDAHALSLIEEINPNLATIRLTVTTRDQLPAPTSYEASPSVDHGWDLVPPANMEVAITARRDQFDQYTSSAYHDAVYAFTNTGDVAIQQLKLRMAFFNERGTPIGENDVLVVYGDDAPILPGETRPVRTLQSLSKNYARYTMTVTEAE